MPPQRMLRLSRTARVSRCLPARLLRSSEALRVPARAAGNSRTWTSSRAAPREVARRDPGGTAPALLRSPRMPARSALGQPVLVRPALRAPSRSRRPAAGAPAEDPRAPPVGGRCCRGMWRLAPPRLLERSSWRVLRTVPRLRHAPAQRKLPRREQMPSPRKMLGQLRRLSVMSPAPKRSQIQLSEISRAPKKPSVRSRLRVLEASRLRASFPA
jgi:hypothetical protein